MENSRFYGESMVNSVVNNENSNENSNNSNTSGENTSSKHKRKRLKFTIGVEKYDI